MVFQLFWTSANSPIYYTALPWQDFKDELRGCDSWPDYRLIRQKTIILRIRKALMSPFWHLFGMALSRFGQCSTLRVSLQTVTYKRMEIEEQGQFNARMDENAWAVEFSLICPCMQRFKPQMLLTTLANLVHIQTLVPLWQRKCWRFSRICLHTSHLYILFQGVKLYHLHFWESFRPVVGTCSLKSENCGIENIFLKNMFWTPRKLCIGFDFKATYSLLFLQLSPSS